MHATALEPRPGALTGLHARRRRRERAQHSLKVVVASLLRAHDVEVHGRRAGAGAYELLAGRARHLYATWTTVSLNSQTFYFFLSLILK